MAKKVERNQTIIKELEQQIEGWQKELEEVWNGVDTEAAEVERRNLRNLIADAKTKIEQLKGRGETSENLQDPKEFLKEIKEFEKRRDDFQKTDGFGNVEKFKALTQVEKNKLLMSLDKLEDERKAYESQKDGSYKDIYAEYTKRIDKINEELEIMDMMDKIYEEKDRSLRILTKGRMDAEQEIDEIKKEISDKQKEISEIQYGTDSAMEEKELSDGTKVKVPKVNRLYQEMDELNKKLKEKEDLRKEFQEYIDEIKGIEKNPNAKNPNGKDPNGKDPNGKDPNGKDPNGKDPNGKDPNGKDPNGKDPNGKDPNGKDPKGKDPNGKDPNGKKPKNKLPIRSFWEIYNSTCTQHVGSIANAINKAAHMKILPQKEEDTLQKALNVVFIPFKAGMKLVSLIPNAINGTDEKLAEMQENIDNLSLEDFQVLVQSPEKVNAMFNAKVKDTFDRDYLEPQFMKQYKVNNAYLDVVRARLGRERGNAITLYNQQAENAERRMQELEEVGKENWTPEQEREYIAKVTEFQNSISEGKKLQAELDAFDEGAKKKSSSYRNISGWLLAKFNPDNREQNEEMAELSRARREAAQQGNVTRVNTITGEMNKKARENTYLKGGRKNYIDIGAYSIESPVETLDRGQQNKGRLLLSNVAIVTSALGLYNQIKDNVANREMVTAHNQQLEQVNQANQNIQYNGEVRISDSPDAPGVEEAITRQTVNAGFNQAERANLEANEFGFGGNYHENDAIVHANATRAAANADNLLKQGKNVEALKTATNYYSNVQKGTNADVTNYMSTHPQHDYTAYTFGGNADMNKVYEFFANGVIPYQTDINGVLSQLMPTLREGVDYNAVIFAGANALYQAQKEGNRDIRRQVRMRRNEIVNEEPEQNRGTQNEQNNEPER